MKANFLPSFVCVLLWASVASATPPYFSIVNSDLFGQSRAGTYMVDGMGPPPNPDPYDQQFYINNPAANFTADSLLNSLSRDGHIAQSAVIFDEQSGTSTSGGIVLDNPGGVNLATIGAGTRVNYLVYDWYDTDSLEGQADATLEIECMGTIYDSVADFGFEIYLNETLIGELYEGYYGDIYLIGDGVHLPGSTLIGGIDRVFGMPNNPYSIISTDILIGENIEVNAIPVGSRITIWTGIGAYPLQRESANGILGFNVDLLADDIYPDQPAP